MILGIDTSCYTTSVAICDDSGRLLCEKRRPLPVESGLCGLRQSEAVFTHIKQLPEIIESICEEMPADLSAVAVSTRPRPCEDSYMPVFLAGAAVARSVAAVSHIPCYATSHQEGHLMAALASADVEWREPFLALHLSGGTGELLQVEMLPTGFDVEQLGGCDLPPGQFIDRVGVALGLPFPSGPSLERLASTAVNCDFRLTGAVRGMQISFSGPESAAQRAIVSGVDSAQVAAAVLDNIAKSLAKAITEARRQSGCKKVLLAGGVAANQRIAERLRPLQVTFASPRFAGDNAFGVARLGARFWRQEEKRNG